MDRNGLEFKKQTKVRNKFFLIFKLFLGLNGVQFKISIDREGSILVKELNLKENKTRSTIIFYGI